MACRYTFFVAGLAQTWHWAFHSCSGLSADGDHKKWGGGYEVRPAHVVAGSANPMPLATRPHGQATSCADFSGVRIEVVREVCSLLPGRKLLAYALQFALWRDVLAQHAKHPLHLVVGGGDQVYNDEVFTYSESLRHWLTLGKEVRGADVVLQAALTELFWQCVPYWPVRALLHTPCSPFQGLLSHLPAICSC